MKSHVARLKELAQNLAAQKTRIGHTCEIASSTGAGVGIQSVVLQNLTYWRGPVQVHIKHVALERGKVYAITGANGCGKSTLLSLLVSCGTFAALPTGMEQGSVKGQISLPSNDIVEITQQMYCPLYIEPIKWLQRKTKSEMQQARRLLSELDFIRDINDINIESVETNWYSKLSGGQRSKVELVSHVFLREKCPDILLIDEAMAPLDFASKHLVQQKLKSFCNESVVLVIHHLDAHNQCVSSGGFFDDNLHFDQGVATLVGTCGDGKSLTNRWTVSDRHYNNCGVCQGGGKYEVCRWSTSNL